MRNRALTEQVQRLWGLMGCPGEILFAEAKQEIGAPWKSSGGILATIAVMMPNGATCRSAFAYHRHQADDETLLLLFCQALADLRENVSGSVRDIRPPAFSPKLMEAADAMGEAMARLLYCPDGEEDERIADVVRAAKRYRKAKL